MNLLKPRFIIIALLLLAIIIVLIYLKTRSVAEKAVPSAEIPVFKQTASPTPQIPYEQLPQDEKMRLQTVSDNNNSTAQDAVLKLYPWYNNFPIKAQNYFVYFDLNQKHFIALLYPQKSSSTSIEDQVASFKKEITDRLRVIDEKTLELQIDWEVKPE